MRAALILLISLFCELAYANDANQLQTLLQSVNTIQADFNQSVLDDFGNLLQSSKGSMSIARPGKFKWRIASPNEQLLIADGEKLWIYDIDLEQVTIKKVTTGIGDTPALLLSGPASDVVKFFNIKKLKHENNKLQFELRSKDKDAMFETITLKFYFDKIQEMRLADSLGQETVVKFSNTKINKTINKNEFNFTPPKGVDVINFM